MTPTEHMLMLQVLFKQRQAIRILLDMLISRGILKDDDEQAFASAQNQHVASNAAIFDEAKEAYLKLAHSLELTTGLENMPEPPLAWFEPPKV
jgi:hypothetical protein